MTFVEAVEAVEDAIRQVRENHQAFRRLSEGREKPPRMTIVPPRPESNKKKDNK